MMLDAATAKHLNNWLERSVYEEERETTVAAIFRALDDDPELIERGFTWREIADRG